MKDKDIVITGLQSWDIEIGSNCKNIAMEFAKNNRVLYVNPPIDRLTTVRNKELPLQYKYGGDENGISEVQDNLWVFYPQKIIESIGRISFNFIFDKLNMHNNEIFASEIKKAMQLIGFKNHIHFCDSDMFRSYYLKELLNPSTYIYYSRDNLLEINYWQIQGKRIEPKHMENADLVLTNSKYLEDKASVYNKNSFFVGQGCDIEHYNPNNVKDIPKDIENVPLPIIGYIGSLNYLRLDISILEYIAENKPEWNIVLIGPEDETFKVSRLHQLKNVHFLGSKPQEELPGYLKAFTVAINPQVQNEITIGNYPRKIDEYLAMGKPTVATDTDAMQYFKDYVSLASRKEDWIGAIEKEIVDNTPQKFEARRQFANEHTWEMNVNNIYKKIEEAENHGNSSIYQTA